MRCLYTDSLWFVNNNISFQYSTKLKDGEVFIVIRNNNLLKKLNQDIGNIKIDFDIYVALND